MAEPGAFGWDDLVHHWVLVTVQSPTPVLEVVLLTSPPLSPLAPYLALFGAGRKFRLHSSLACA